MKESFKDSLQIKPRRIDVSFNSHIWTLLIYNKGQFYPIRSIKWQVISKMEHIFASFTPGTEHLKIPEVRFCRWFLNNCFDREIVRERKNFIIFKVHLKCSNYANHNMKYSTLASSSYSKNWQSKAVWIST